jgi:hypothetical protein
MLLFTETDKKIFERKLKDRPYFVSWYPGEKKDYAEDSEKIYHYHTTVKIALERLDILGFTLTKVKSSLEEKIKERCHFLEKSLKDITVPNGDYFIKKELEAIQKSGFESFKGAFQEIKENRFTINNLESKQLSNLAKYLLRRSHYDWQYYYPDQHPLNYLRFILECCKSSADVTLDFTDLVRSGFATKEANIRDISIKNTSMDYAIFSKILVLTEGESDAEILKIALAKLYPYLSNYYLFMPFHLTEISRERKIPGSAQALLQRIKSFAACQINNRIIGVFDNDYEGRNALKQIDPRALPDNIKLISYPDIEANKEYPISNGNYKDINYKDINGKAAFLETYFGSQVMEAVAKEKPEIIIFNKEKGKIAITWKKVEVKNNNGQVGLFNESTHKDKKQDKNEEIKKALQDKMKAMLEQDNDNDRSDWSDIKAIFESIFHCFQE